MTRAIIPRPVWTWYCDDCGASSGDLTLSQHELPTPDEMNARGWRIADRWGDKCPDCRAMQP